MTAFPSLLSVVAILFISLAFSFSLASSRAFSIVSRSVSRDIIFTSSLSSSLFSLPPFASHPSLSTYKRFDWNRSTSRQARKQARHFKWRFLPLFLFPPLELLLAFSCLLFRFLLHLYVTIVVICIAIVQQVTSTCNFPRFLFHCMMTLPKNRGTNSSLKKNFVAFLLLLFLFFMWVIKSLMYLSFLLNFHY